MTPLTSIFLHGFVAGETFLADVDDPDELDEAARDFADAELERAREEDRHYCAQTNGTHDELCARRLDGDR